MKSPGTSGLLVLTALAHLTGCARVVAEVRGEDAAVVDAADVAVRDAAVRDASSDVSIDDVPPDNAGCADRDHDGYGLGPTCRGLDCNDGDPRITVQCALGCNYPEVETGCACRPGSPSLPCDLDTGRVAADPGGICNLGQRDCAQDGASDAWVWSACAAWRNNFRYVGPISACPGACVPGCRHQVICPAAGDPLLDGSRGLRVAERAPAVFCPSGTPRGGLTLACADPAGNAARCEVGVYTRVFDGDCTPPTVAIDDPFYRTLPYWGQLNFKADVPAGTSIAFDVRAADTVAGLATAREVAVGVAPEGAPSLPTSLELRRILRADSRSGEALWNRRYLQLTATLIPSADGAAAPTLISTETQYTCLPDE